ncbi:LysR substrate-binding domain-containing protein [Neorhizobium galegae]|uniref:LysR substrate-binding domain-containing protein n=1 Tax=Neorhizobium galegae TaxID=399 RepID=UPI0006214A7F|nr:LysR substrate-binding domain-containing protein [Neorhizobium galegae]CDZ54449.1 LysR [Neorhizobium galegae bv. orientalis]
MELNPRQVEAFRAVMMTGSMTAAADLLRVTQPAVSRLIKDLEADLNFRLFRRDGNRLIPTQEGTILFAEVDRFYIGMDRVAKIAKELRHTRTGSLRIAAISSLCLSCMTDAIREFNAGRPAVRVTLESLNSLSILELVAGRHFDIGFAQVGGEFPGVSVLSLPSPEAVCVLPVDLPISAKPVIECKDLEGLPFISLGRNQPFRLKVDEMFAGAGVARQEILETSLAASAVAMVASGMGVSIVDPFSAAKFENDGYVTRPFSPRLTFDVQAVTPPHHNSRLGHEFLQIVRNIFKSVPSPSGGASPDIPSEVRSREHVSQKL